MPVKQAQDILPILRDGQPHLPPPPHTPPLHCTPGVLLLQIESATSRALMPMLLMMLLMFMMMLLGVEGGRLCCKAVLRTHICISGMSVKRDLVSK
jgi:hypothetical protein